MSACPGYRQLNQHLTEALAVAKMPGLLSVALSGSGPIVIALATDDFDEIGETIAARLSEHNSSILEADINGLAEFA
ncbi:MAG: hypothetical protein ABR555_13035 [Pyrinomonadaceae bacterium]